MYNFPMHECFKARVRMYELFRHYSWGTSYPAIISTNNQQNPKELKSIPKITQRPKGNMPKLCFDSYPKRNLEKVAKCVGLKWLLVSIQIPNSVFWYRLYFISFHFIHIILFYVILFYSILFCFIFIFFFFLSFRFFGRVFFSFLFVWLIPFKPVALCLYGLILT